MNKTKYSVAAVALACGLLSSTSLAAMECAGLPVWDDSQVYTGGNMVQHSGNAYEAKWWTKGNTPVKDAQYTVWQFKHSCGETPVTPDPVTPVPVTPDPVTPTVQPVTPAPITPTPITPAPVTPLPATPVPATPEPVDGATCSAYSQGASYNKGDQIYSPLGAYQCEVAGWCSSDSDAYVPGKGSAHKLAWSKLTGLQCVAPTPEPVTPDTNPPGSPEGVKDPNFPDQALSGFWRNALTRDGLTKVRNCPTRLNNVPDHWDVIYIGGAVVEYLPFEQRLALPFEEWVTGDMTFDAFQGYDPYDAYAEYNRPNLPDFSHLACDPLDANELKQDIAALKAKGKTVILSVNKIDGFIDTDSKAARFTATATEIINEWGFDGLDINTVQHPIKDTHFEQAIRHLDDGFNNEKFITMTSSHFMVDQLRDILDQVRINPTSNSYKVTPETGKYPDKFSRTPAQRIVSVIRDHIEGIPLDDTTYFHGLRPDQVAIELDPKAMTVFTTRLGKTETGAGRVNCLLDGKTIEQCRAFFTEIVKEQEMLNAIDCVTTGANCPENSVGEIYPEFDGIVIRDIVEDDKRNSRLGAPLKQKLSGQ